MVKAVFTTKIDPAYDDLPEVRYHFPRSYLRQAEASVGDWILYYEPRRGSDDPRSRGGRQAYFATARVDRIAADPDLPDHFYAFVSGFLPFDRAVRFEEGGSYYESALRRADGGTSKGAFGRAVRNLSDGEYARVVEAGFVRAIGEVDRQAAPVPFAPGLAEDPPALFVRPIVERLVSRPFREAAFAVAVKSAYGETCAMTGLRLINGGGRAEVQAAHIRPVADHGPDSVRNGLALSGTLHWMFDRGLVSIDDDHRILVADRHVPEAIVRLINPDRRLRAPMRPELMPHPQFLHYHRTVVFKG